MSIVVPPLTGLTEANGRVFPMHDIITMIDGRNEVRGHGSGMPEWGAVYNDPLASEISGQSPDFIVRGRILFARLLSGVDPEVTHGTTYDVGIFEARHAV